MYTVVITDFSAIPHWSAYSLITRGYLSTFHTIVAKLKASLFSARANFIYHSWRELQIGEMYVLIIGSLR